MLLLHLLSCTSCMLQTHAAGSGCKGVTFALHRHSTLCWNSQWRVNMPHVCTMRIARKNHSRPLTRAAARRGSAHATHPHASLRTHYAPDTNHTPLNRLYFSPKIDGCVFLTPADKTLNFVSDPLLFAVELASTCKESHLLSLRSIGMTTFIPILALRGSFARIR